MFKEADIGKQLHYLSQHIANQVSASQKTVPIKIELTEGPFHAIGVLRAVHRRHSRTLELCAAKPGFPFTAAAHFNRDLATGRIVPFGNEDTDKDVLQDHTAMILVDMYRIANYAHL